MAKEATKFHTRWEREGLWKKYIAGGKKILDIGCGKDKITPDATGWDKEQGNGQFLVGLDDESFDVVFSSHFVEHLADPLEGILNQWRVLRPGGYLIFLVPDEDLYEQGIWPPIFNDDHKYSWTISKTKSWCPSSKNLINLLRYLPDHKIWSMRIVDEGYDYDTTQIFDQTLESPAEAAIEVIVQKLPLQLVHQTKLRDAFVCPACKRMDFIIRGITKDERYDLFCKSCGISGTMVVNPNESNS